MGKKGREAITG